MDLPTLSGATNHNGGGMHFGSDGKLYVGVGENANGAQAQNLASPFGKLLRFNEDGTIPTDNPFYATPERAWRARSGPPACATRSPSRCSPAPAGSTSTTSARTPGRRSTSAWPARTTAGRAPKGPNNVGAGITAPLFAYPHSDTNPPGSGPGGFFTGFAIAGGAFYPANGPFPAGYRDQYYFADFVSKFVGRLDWQTATRRIRSPSLSGSPVDLLVGIDGALYVLTRSGVTRISAP